MLLSAKMSDHVPHTPKLKMGRKNSKESIHSGHFMVSDFEAEAQDEEGLEVPEQQEAPQPVQQIRGVQSITQGDVITYAKPTNRNDRTIVSIDASLTKLFNTMSIAYRQNITSPKWNRFKGLKLRWKDKIRLNNVIWRCWHLQFVLKKRMRVCPFALDVDIHTKPETTLLEGKYWKRRIEAVTAEYKKWRVFSKNRQAGILMNCEGSDEQFFGLEEMEWARSFLGNEGEMPEFDFMDVLLASPQQFHFPNVRELARGTENSDLLQPGLIQLQPSFNDDFVDFHDMLARDLPTVPEEELFPEVENNVGLPPSPPSPISTPTPNMHYTARMTASQYPSTSTSGSTTDLSFGSTPYVMETAVNSTESFPPANTYDLGAYDKTIQSRSPSRENRSRIIARSRSQQELNPRSTSPFRPDAPSQFAAPKPYARRRSHSGSISAFSPAGNVFQTQLLNTLSVPSIPSAVTSTGSPSVTPSYRFPEKPVSKHAGHDSRNSTLLSQLLSPSGESPPTSTPPPPTAPSSFKLSLVLPPNSLETSPSENPSVNLRNSVAPTSQGLNSPFASTKDPNSPHFQATMGVPPNVTLSAVTPSSLKLNSSFPKITAWPSDPNVPQTSAINLKTSPPQNIPSPPLGAVPSALHKPFRPKNDVERVQYKEHRRKCHISAEQKRRCNIKNNFEHLHSLIPSVSHNPNSKVSKATMLNKGADYIQQLKTDRHKLKEKADSLRKEIEKLGGDISAAQSLLPATGAPLSHTRHSKLQEKFQNYVRDRTLTNWKFYVFSLVAEPLLESFSGSVSTCSIDDLSRSSLAWLDQHCSLNVLRPIVSNSMRKLSTTTSILTAPEYLPEETVRFVTKRESGQGTPTLAQENSSTR